jgi:hypothetical protein
MRNAVSQRACEQHRVNEDLDIRPIPKASHHVSPRLAQNGRGRQLCHLTTNTSTKSQRKNASRRRSRSSEVPGRGVREFPTHGSTRSPNYLSCFTCQVLQADPTTGTLTASQETFTTLSSNAYTTSAPPLRKEGPTSGD